MPASHQWLILANIDRAAYHLPPISGIASALNAFALAGAQQRRDPNPWPLLQSLPGQMLIGFGSNWAGGQPNGLVAYFGWMYDDGFGGENIDCRTATAAGCWGHRQNILGFATAPVLTMGAAAIAATMSYALTIVETSTAPWPLSYRAPALSRREAARDGLQARLSGRRARRRVHVLGQPLEPARELVDLLGQVGVLLQQLRLELRELLAMRGVGLLVGAVGPRLRLLGDDHERSGVERDGREDEVQQDERLGIESLAVDAARARRVLRNVMRWLEKTHARMIVVLTTRKPTVPIPLATFSDMLSMKLEPPA